MTEVYEYYYRERGRPKKFTPAKIKQITAKLPEMFSEGQSVAEVCAELKMSKHTFYRLVENDVNFSNAYDEGLSLSEAWWTRLGRQGAACAVDIQPATWTFNMKNRFKWKDKQEVTGEDGQPLFGGLADAIQNNLPKPK